MDARQENKVSMYLKIKTFFVTYLTAIAAKISAITAVVGNFNTRLTDLTGFETIASTDITGYSIQKNALRQSMCDKAMAVAGGVKAYFLSIGQRHEAQKAHLTRSELEIQRDSDVLVTCNGIYTLANDNAAAIIPFGVTTVKLNAFKTSFDEYFAFIQSPADQRSLVAGAGQDVDQCITDIDEILESIDAMMETIAEDEPSIYTQYQYDRLIDDNTGGGTSTPPDVSTSLPPESTTNVYTITFLASRVFKAKNKGTNPIQWALSTDPNSFTHGMVNIDPGSTSTYLSENLGNGDYLNFRNDHPDAIEIDVWVVE